MKTFFSFNILRKTIIQFLDTLNDINIARYDDDGNIIKYIKVPIKLATPETAFLFAKQWTNEKIMPFIGVQVTDITFDSNRMVNKLEKIKKDDGTTIDRLVSSFINPVPYNVDFSVNIIALNMVDIDQILEQILPYYSPYIYIRIYIPEVDFSFDIKVIFNSCSPDMNVDRAMEDERSLSWLLSFTAQSYMFQPLTDVHLIEKIITKFYTTQEGWEHHGTETMFTSGGPNSYESEAIFTKALGRDQDAQILSSYQIFSVEDYEGR
jgi:hypothetical protein